MSKRVYQDLAAEREATEIGKKFMNSTDVVGDMSRAYHTDLSSVRIHADSDSDYKTAQRGVDAFSTGTDVFFARAAFNKNDPASRGLLAHELSHSLQQGVGGEMGGMAHSAPMGAEQGGLIDWFRKVFGKKEDKINFMAKGERRPEENGKAMSFKQMHNYANSGFIRDENGNQMSRYDKVMRNLRKDKRGQYADGYTDMRQDLIPFIHSRYENKEENEILDRALVNASGTLEIGGLNAQRLLTLLQGTTGGSMSNEDVGKLYDNLLSGGEAAEYNHKLVIDARTDERERRRTGKDPVITPEEQALRDYARSKVSAYSADEINARDAKFMAGIQQLKGIYLQQLRRLRNKYGTYVSQMHPEDVMSKIGMTFYDDFALIQDVMQLIESNKDGQILDYENNADDRE